MDASYSLVRDNRSRSIRIAVHPDGQVVVSAPRLVPTFLIEQFVSSKKEWIQIKQEKFKMHPIHPMRLSLRKMNNKDYENNKERAFNFLSERTSFFNQHYGFRINSISIRNQKSRWGSCSKKGNINFNYKLIFLPENMSDYVIVHELCHLKELNHSKKFWNLVRKTVPDYESIRKELKKIG